MPGREISASTITVLLVCTGNICRSALGERFGRAYLHEALGAAAADVHLASAGTRARSGSGMHPDTAPVLEGLGGDPAGFTARQLEAAMVTDADLVLTLTREHRRTVLELAPRALSRTFTLREAAALLDVLDGARPAGEGFGDRARALVATLAAARGRRSGGADDDIADPMGRPVDAHQEVGQAVAEALLRVLTALVAVHPARDGAGPSVDTTSSIHEARGDALNDGSVAPAAAERTMHIGFAGGRPSELRRRRGPFGLLGRRGASA
ncbi:MAG: protein-tyrosine-phosphatase [Actinomycetota bacterium]|nr:protein-tyrosine-phosphatase [Actinomycetota bacterium]